ncbi:hypothetical protein PN36_15065 [Candidatus Thiomargarita nelsonii]|uniref:Uncharacterized protein n=1 Tax=Candidatus Thiomargarita nelsonii TaxID=1003181 RepID=A0A4E0R1X4_9GAMM|nr:hypothetical protein PN36_15065 [Candidatus Thiomargarita nelsonii]
MGRRSAKIAYAGTYEKAYQKYSKPSKTPKKYVRHWPERLKAAEPSTNFRGILGQRDGLHPMLDFVQHTLDQMLQQVLSSLTNPQSTSDKPEFYPQIARLMLTYPLTWREDDRKLFKSMMEKAAARIFVQEKPVKEQFKVELICSEPPKYGCSLSISVAAPLTLPMWILAGRLEARINR